MNDQPQLASLLDSSKLKSGHYEFVSQPHRKNNSFELISINDTLHIQIPKGFLTTTTAPIPVPPACAPLVHSLVFKNVEFKPAKFSIGSTSKHDYGKTPQVPETNVRTNAVKSNKDYLQFQFGDHSPVRAEVGIDVVISTAPYQSAALKSTRSNISGVIERSEARPKQGISISDRQNMQCLQCLTCGILHRPELECKNISEELIGRIALMNDDELFWRQVQVVNPMTLFGREEKGI